MSIKIKYQNDDKDYNFYSFYQMNNYDKVVHIDCSYCHLKLLPELPNSLEELRCVNNQFINKIKYTYFIKIIYL